MPPVVAVPPVVAEAPAVAVPPVVAEAPAVAMAPMVARIPTVRRPSSAPVPFSHEPRANTIR